MLRESSRRPVHPLVQQLREERIRQGLSLAKLEKMSGYANQHIWQIEVGRQSAKIEIVEHLAQCLGLSLVLEKRE